MACGVVLGVYYYSWKLRGLSAVRAQPTPYTSNTKILVVRYGASVSRDRQMMIRYLILLTSRASALPGMGLSLRDLSDHEP